MSEHVCTVCFRPFTDHSEQTDKGRHLPPLCCPGCTCGSYEEAPILSPHERGCPIHYETPPCTRCQAMIAAGL